MKKLFDNPKPVLYAIGTFVALLLLLFAVKSRGSDLTFEAGSAMLRGETPTIGLAITWPQAGPVGTDYELGFQLVGQSDGKSGPQPIGDLCVFLGRDYRQPIFSHCQLPVVRVLLRP